MASGRLIDYLGVGVIADRPATPTLFADTLGLWYATDTSTLSTWDGSAWDDVGGGAADFTDLGDVPASYTGQALKIVRVNAGETGLEFSTAGGGSGDVVGPASAVDDRIATFDGITGKLIQDGGVTVAQLALLASPTFTGTPAAPTAAPGTNTTQIATTAYADAIAALKANLASPTFTGTPAAPTASAGTNTTQLATTAFVTTADNLKAPLASPTFTGTHTVSEADVVTGIISPAQITANTNDYAPTGFSVASNVRVNTDACRAITGLAGGASGRRVYLHNVGTFDILLTKEDSASTAANRFAIPHPLILQPNSTICLWYDTASSRWRVADHFSHKVTNTLAADVTTSGTADLLQDVTGLSFSALSGKAYNFYFCGAFSSSGGGNGARFSVNGPAASLISYRAQYSASGANAPITVFNSNAYDLPATSATTSSSTGANQFYIEGTVIPSADGTVQLRFASEGASPTNTITAIAKACFVEYEAN